MDFDPPFGDVCAVFREAVRGFLPTKRLTVAEHALAHRQLQNVGGGYVGKFSFDRTPYIREPLELLTDRQTQTVAVVGPGQVGKTVIAENFLLYSVDADPASMLWYLQTDETVESYVKGVINPMVDAHPEMATKQGLRPVDDSLHFKRFRGMHVEFLSANSQNLINKKAPRIVADEIDAYPQALGDVKALLDVRRQTFGSASKLLMLSHPDAARGLDPQTDWSAGIMAVYGDSTRCVWYWPCPHCGAWSSPAPIGVRVMTIDYPTDVSLAEIEGAARLLCPVNGCLIENGARHQMNLRGRWIGIGEEIDEDGTVTGERCRNSIAGYWLVGAMSPFVMGGIGGLARARVKAERERDVSGDDGTLRQVVVKQWGIPYAPARGVGSVDAAVLVERTEVVLPLGRVPPGVRFLVCAVDVQLSHFEYLVRGWGVNGESWIIDHGKILADPATSAESWDQLLDAVFVKSYPVDDRTVAHGAPSGRRMQIRGCGYDSGGAPGVAQQAYAAWSRWRKRRGAQPDGRFGSPVRALGKISGRDVFSILPLKGASGINAPKLNVTFPDTTRAANAAAARGTVPVGIFNPNLFKDDLAGQLMCAEPGNWYIHFPAGLKSREPPHTFFEQLTSEVRRPNGRWEKAQAAARNETLDLMTMTHVLAYLHGLGRIDWERPPVWAGDWADNPMILPPEGAPDAPRPLPAAMSLPEPRKPPTAPAQQAEDARRRAILKQLAK